MKGNRHSQLFTAQEAKAGKAVNLTSLPPEAVSSETLLPIDPRAEQWFLGLLEGFFGCQADSNGKPTNDNQTIEKFHHVVINHWKGRTVP